MQTTSGAGSSASAIVRKATVADAQACLKFAQFIFTTSDQLLRVPDELKLTVEQEAEWIDGAQKNNNLILIATYSDDVVGLLDCHKKLFEKMKHVAEFGISVHPGHRGNRVGSRMIETMLKWVGEETQIEKLILNVFNTNTRAIKLYERFGFKEECRQIKAAKQPDGCYVDMIQMYKLVR